MRVALRFCEVERLDWGTEVRFEDGSKVPAVPHMTPRYHVIAHRCGYADDVGSYCFEHEVAHALVEQELHDRPSRVLWALAHGERLSGPEAAYEEIVAQAFQRYLRAGEEPIVGGVDWAALRRLGIRLLGS